MTTPELINECGRNFSLTPSTVRNVLATLRKCGWLDKRRHGRKRILFWQLSERLAGLKGIHFREMMKGIDREQKELAKLFLRGTIAEGTVGKEKRVVNGRRAKQ
jgi:DNA-binding IclR family transcriptional regulator